MGCGTSSDAIVEESSNDNNNNSNNNISSSQQQQVSRTKSKQPSRGSLKSQDKSKVIKKTNTGGKIDQNSRTRAIHKAAFEKYDKDHNGKINSSELSNVIAELRWESSDEELKQAMKQLVDKNGEIGLDDFMKWVQKAGKIRLSTKLNSSMRLDSSHKVVIRDRKNKPMMAPLSGFAEEDEYIEE